MEEVARRPGVPAEDLTAVLQVHADRVHDAVRRLGVDAATAVEVVESSALALVDAVATRPQDVPDAVGWWLAAARRLSRTARASEPDLPIGGGLLSCDEDQLVLAEALEGLAEDDRLAVLVRDTYRLPWPTVAAALELPADRAARAVARARLAAVPLLDDEPAPTPLHAERLPELARLGEPGRVEARDATARRHVPACSSCSAVVAAQGRVSLLLSGVAVVALPDDARVALLERAEGEAARRLPPASALVLTEQELDEWDDDDPRVLPPLVAVAGVLLAMLLGLALGVLLSRGTGAVLPTSSGVLPAVPLPPVQTSEPVAPAAVAPPPPVPAPRTSVFFLPPPTPSPRPVETSAAPAGTPRPTSSPAAATAVQVEPRSGPNGATLRVTGAGWQPGSTVAVEYLDLGGRPTGSRTTAQVAEDGTFTASLLARDPAGLPGRHEVRATSGSTTRSAGYEATA